MVARGGSGKSGGSAVDVATASARAGEVVDDAMNLMAHVIISMVTLGGTW